MGRTCCAPHCRTGYPLKKGESQKVGPKPALFIATKDPDLFKKWNQKIPRKDFVLKSMSFVCELHFLPEDVQKTYSGFPSDVTALQTVRKDLRPGAVPVLWPGCPDHLSKTEKQKRKPSGKRKMPDDNEKTSSASKKNRLTDPANEEIGFEDSDYFDMTDVFLDPSLVAEPDISREIIEYPSEWTEVKQKELLVKKKRVVCELLVNPTTEQPFIMKSAKEKRRQITEEKRVKGKSERNQKKI